MQWKNDFSLDSSARFRATPHKVFALGVDRFLVIAWGLDLHVELSGQMKEVLDSCSVGDTIPGLIVRAQNKLKGSPTAIVEQVIRQLLEKHLLVAEDRLVQEIPECLQSTRIISAIAFPSAERALQLRDSLLSYARNAKDHGHELEFIVMDGSNVATRNSYFDSLHEIANQCRIRYGGWSEKAAYVKLLIEEGVAPDVARFALLGEIQEVTCTTGANRNAILLDTTGNYIISVDDDTLCKLAVHPKRSSTLNLADAGDPREKWFYEHRSDVQAEIRHEDLDFVGHHQDLLGSSVASLVAQTSDINFQGICDRILRAVRNNGSRIAATMSGVAGDSGMYSAVPLLRSTGDTLNRLCSSESSLRCALRSRQVLSLVRGPTIVHRCPFMGYAMGLANDGLLPPFLPVGRNQDGLFGVLLGVSTPHFIGHIPLAVFHDNPLRKEYEPFPSCRVADLLSILVVSVVGDFTRTAPVSLGFIGNALLEAGRLKDPDFAEWVSEVFARHWAEHMRAMDRSLRMHPEFPIFWRDEVLNAIEQGVRQLKDTNSWIPVEFRERLPLESARHATKRLISLFGALLRDWCHIVELTERLRQRERRITVQISEV